MFCIFDILDIQVIVHILKCYLQIVIYQLELDLEFTFTILICSTFLTITFNLLLTFLFCIIEIILSIVIFTSTVRKKCKEKWRNSFYILLHAALLSTRRLQGWNCSHLQIFMQILWKSWLCINVWAEFHSQSSFSETSCHPSQSVIRAVTRSG